jgi:calcium-dependent protein kinase
MGAHQSSGGNKGLEDAVRRAASRLGNVSVTGRYHRLPRKFEDDYRSTGTVLGSGYNGSVFLAESLTSKDKFAVKAFKLHGIGTEKRKELETECEIFLSMDHPHVARLADCYETEDVLSLVMECMSGGELFKRVVAKKRFNEKDAVDTTWQMLLAVSYIHSHNVVHRDIKLENFLYEKEGSNHLKLIDFGFSKVWTPNTKLHLSCGTLAYVAPEVLSQNYTSQCDMWSLGVTVFILLFGYMPFSGSEERQHTMIKAGKFTKKDAWNKVSEQARDFVGKLLVVDPEKRMDAKGALTHTWVAQRDHLNLEQHDVDEGIVDALANFGQASHFRRACMSMMAWSLTNDERKQVRDAFIELDTDRSGTISIHEFKKVLEERFHIDDAHVMAAFESLDTSHMDEIHYSDFLAAMVSSRIQLHDDLLKQTFKRFDTQNQGYITKESLRQVLGETHDGEDIEHLIEEADTSHDGKIDYDEFIYFLKESGQDHHHEAANKIIDYAHSHSDCDHKKPRMKAKAGDPRREAANTPAGSQGGCCSLQ